MRRCDREPTPGRGHRLALERFEFSFPPPARRRCRVRAGRGALTELVEDLASTPPGRRLFVVADHRVAALYAEALCRRLRRRGVRVDLLTFRAGESSKTRRTKQRLEDRLVRLGADRECALVAVGGGVTGDLAGFVAATWQRGVPVVQVPTSLLAMADAALGGKTAVNLPAGKNLVGCFHQPWGVYADVEVLATLHHARFSEGLAEMVKSAAIADRGLFRWLERHVGELLARDTAALEHAVARCLRIKARIVRGDERDRGRRAMLNFGHTVAHALEAATRYRIPHGRAVAVGLRVEARIAAGVTGFPAPDLARLEALLGACGLPAAPPVGVSAAAIVRATYRDKKVRRGRVHYALPLELGRMPPGPRVTVPVPEGALRRALRVPPSRRSH